MQMNNNNNNNNDNNNNSNNNDKIINNKKTKVQIKKSRIPAVSVWHDDENKLFDFDFSFRVFGYIKKYCWYLKNQSHKA